MHTFEASLSDTPGVILYLCNKQPKSDSLALFLMDLPLDCFSLIVEKLGSNDVTSLLYSNKQVREDTLAVLSPQQLLWAAGKILNTECAERALFAGARINKIDPATGKSVLKLIEGRSGGEKLYARLESWNDHEKTFGPASAYSAKAQTQEQLNWHLLRCVTQLVCLEYYGECWLHNDQDIQFYHPYGESDYLDHGIGRVYMDLAIKEALLDGADPNVRTQEGGLLHTLIKNIDDIIFVQPIVDVIKDLKSFGIDMNQATDRSHWFEDFPGQQTALHYACCANPNDRPIEPGIRPVIVKTLLYCGAYPNAVNSSGMTPLHDLVFYHKGAGEELLVESHTLARMLISYGADVTRTNHNGLDVIDLIATPEFDDWETDHVMLGICEKAWDFKFLLR